MAHGTASLTVTVVPDSGTEQLAALTGTMTINVVGGALVRVCVHPSLGTLNMDIAGLPR